MRKAFTLPVAHVNYTVRFCRSVKHRGKKVHGLCDPKTRTISIELKHNMEFMRQTIWHEFFHALCWETQEIIDGVNEQRTDKTADAIMRVRADCPWL